MVELVSVRGKDVKGGGRQIPLESGVALNLESEPLVAIDESGPPPPEPPEESSAGRISSAPESVSALPAVASRPPRGLVKTFVHIPPAKGPRDSLDDAWDSGPNRASSPSPALPLPDVELPKAILSEDALAAPSGAPPGAEEDAWAEVPDDAPSEELASAPSGPVLEALHDAVSAEHSQDSGVLDDRNVAAAIPPAWAPRPFAVLGQEAPSSSARTALRRFGPWLGGGVALIAIATGAVMALTGKEQPQAAPQVEPSPPPRATAKEAEAPPEKEPKAEPARAPEKAEPEAESEGNAKAASGKSPFNHKAANAALAKAAVKAKACKKPKDTASSASAAVTFAASGNVTTVNVSGKKVRGTALATCVSKALKAVHVPPFDGAAVTLKKTIPLK